MKIRDGLDGVGVAEESCAMRRNASNAGNRGFEGPDVRLEPASFN
jgi:hypothetical protein